MLKLDFVHLLVLLFLIFTSKSINMNEREQFFEKYTDKVFGYGEDVAVALVAVQLREKKKKNY